MARGKIFGALVHKRAEESNPVEEPKATERPPLPCFSGFGLPRCSQVSATGWDGDSTAGFAVKDDFFCLQCYALVTTPALNSGLPLALAR